MNLTKKILASSILITATAFSNQVSAFSIGGINVGSVGAVSLQDASAETVVTTVGDTLYGIGQITKINGVGGFSNTLELDFIYSAKVSFDSGTTIIFDTGSLTFFTNTIGFYDSQIVMAGNTMALAQTAIASGTDWLDLAAQTVTTLAPYNVFGAPSTGAFFGSGTDLAGSVPNGSGVGYFDVITSGSGIANAFFDTNALLFNGITPYDFLFTSTFHFESTSPKWGPIQDASTFKGVTKNVDEPDTLALLGLGLLATALLSRRRQPDLKLI